MYIDDIVIFSKSVDEHYGHIKEIFGTLQAANLKVQLHKCNFLRSEVECLGFVISADGIKTNKKKVQAIVDFPLPKTLKEL